jgi:type IV pilus biogenesis protein CpaD/CtpE
MRHAILLAAAAALAACAGRTEDETGAAPAPDDTTAVTHAIDSTRTGPPGVSGRHGDATVTVDSVLDDTSGVRRDTMITTGDSLSSSPQDTLGPDEPNTTPPPDTSSWR